ncbi:MAG: DUF362 domain-containing protein [Oscillospiraceae bacterium]|nr:DUF362 domain-containing protein [Oscillospiraceae bacterium]
MSKSKVYFTTMHTTSSENLLQKLERLMRTAGIEAIDFHKKYAAIKIHFGEPGNLSYLRPNYARAVADVVKKLGGYPFLTDCNTLYVGGRKNALEHIESAYVNGFTPYTTGCHIIIGDGLKGNDDVPIPVSNGEYIKEAKIGRAIVDADIILSLTHFKCHECTGIGGTIKNLGMGCGSRGGKMEMHSNGKPFVNQEACVGCGMCTKNCAHGAITVNNRKASVDHEKCVGCGRCIGACPMDAVYSENNEANDILSYKMAEYAKAVVEGKPQFHISLVIDVSPFCDCHPENDSPIIPDVGMFASFDPVALDLACAQAALKQPVLSGSRLDEMPKDYEDHFTNTHPVTNWRSQIDHGEKIGLGSTDYELIEI